jgi:PIN domain nuclease of toxin-antitoxin system
MATPNYQTPNYVLDSFALVAYFQAEPGGEIVSRLLERAQRSEISL